ncbi:3-oxo-tetronate kinase [Billgrantia sp. LNSP4103-1]|uniref:3-oxo-tetronate kinase n=1 Tax=Billgrantia sp. LNSP4103-1 TaxID=3410266 RepID=UPI00403F8026
MKKPLLGCIADDFTGGTDLASTLVQGGMRTIQCLGVPSDPIDTDADAVVVALKTRTCDRARAIEESLQALSFLREAGCEQFFYKYCSTFDSTDRGNIGPVADALMDALDIRFTIACPAFPENERTVYKGHLFVGDALLSDSSMRDHPLTPMRDANLVRVLGRQTAREVYLCHQEMVDQGASRLRERFTSLSGNVDGYAIVDATTAKHLYLIGEAAANLRLITGGSGIARGLPLNFIKQGKLQAPDDASRIALSQGNTLILAGSCSAMTNKQVAHWLESRPGYRLDPLSLAEGDAQVNDAIAWALDHLPRQSVLIYASADPGAVKQVQAVLGTEAAGTLVESALARIARAVHEHGIDKYVIAGGETSGAVLQALEVKALRIGPEVAPGVPWTVSTFGPPLSLALKSGNFGDERFFTQVIESSHE